MQTKILLLIILLGLISCEKENKKLNSTNEIAIQYKEHSLLFSDLNKLIPSDLSDKDSALWVESYIEKWLKEKLLLEEAKEKLGSSAKTDIEERVKLYEQDLLLNEYTNFILKNIETDSITDEEINQYYEANKKSFITNQPLIQYQYIVLENNNQSKQKILHRLGKTSDENTKWLQNYAQETQLPYYQTPENEWEKKPDLVHRIIPKLQDQVKDRTLRSNQFFKASDDQLTYYLKILKTINKGDIAPLNYVKTSIKTKLINKRKLVLLKKLKNQLYQNAKENQTYELYKPY